MIHVACLPYSNSLAYSLCATNDILTNVRLSFKVDELDLTRVHLRTKELFDSCFGVNEQVDISEVVANGLRACVMEVSSQALKLDRIAGEPIDVLVNGKFVAKGEVVVIEESFGIRVTEIIK